MSRLTATISVELSPGEIRALAKLSNLHPHTAANISEWTDRASVGWAIVVFNVRTNNSRAPVSTFRYIVSPTGRAWTATGDNERIEPAVFEADYEETHR